VAQSCQQHPCAAAVGARKIARASPKKLGIGIPELIEQEVIEGGAFVVAGGEISGLSWAGGSRERVPATLPRKLREHRDVLE
jgi:hypothetical protein